MKMILAVVFAALLIVPARAEDKPAAPAKDGWSGFFKNLKSSLSQSAVSGERKAGRRAQGVAAVRGASQGKKSNADPNEPNIKGDSKSAKANKERGWDAELEGSIDLVTKGDLNGGLKGLEKFKADHAKYRVEDVDKAIEGVKAMMADAKAAPAAAETAAAPAAGAVKP